MNSSPDTEITLGTVKLLGLFFGLVMLCAVFFALGYTLGRKADAGLPMASAAAPLPAAVGGKAGSSVSPQAAPPMTFYKAVEQKDASGQLTPAAADAGSTGGQASTAPAAATSAGAASSGAQAPPQAGSVSDSIASISTSVYFVQVAAVTKPDDAEALVEALRKKQYPAFVASATDKLFHVQVGPFADNKEAETTRTRLINDGYNPILKK